MNKEYLESIVSQGSQFCGICLKDEKTLASQATIIKALTDYDASTEEVNELCGYECETINHGEWAECVAYVYADGSVYIDTNGDPIYYSGSEHMWAETYAQDYFTTLGRAEKIFNAKIYRTIKKLED